MASREEEKAKLREERKAQEAADSASKEKQAKARKFAMIGGGVLLVVAVVVGVVVAAGGGGDEKMSSADPETVGELEFVDAPAPAAAIALKDGSQKDLLAAAKKAGCTFNSNKNEGSTHKDPGSEFKYVANPPTSGNHTPTWAEDGAYPEVTYETPFLVHGLEHGRVEYIWDEQKVTKQQLGTLKKLYDDDSYHLILHPSTTDMPYAIAAVSWDHSLTCPEMNDDVYSALRLYKLNWTDQAPEQVP